MKRNYFYVTLLTTGLTLMGCSNKTGSSSANDENYLDKTFQAMVDDNNLVLQEARMLDLTGNEMEMLNDDELDQEELKNAAFFAHFEQPLLWDNNGDEKYRKMADFYNYCQNVNAIQTDVDTWYRADEDEELLEQMYDSWRKVTFTGISDTWVVGRLTEARNSNTDKSNTNIEARNTNDVYDYLSDWAPDLDSTQVADEVISQIEPKHFLPADLVEHFDEYVRPDESDEVDMGKLYQRYEKEKNYDTKLAMLYLLLGGGSYHAEGNELEQYLHEAEQVMTSGNYSPMMPMLWRAYRAMYCWQYSCPSTYCDIPNVRFNYYRRLVAYTFLRHLQEKPDDTAAYVQYYMMAFRPNINRFGDYPFGHQGAAEMILVFWQCDPL